MDLLPLGASYKTLDNALRPLSFFERNRHVARVVSAFAKPHKLERKLHQFWDTAPPDQIGALLEHNATICGKIGVEHVVWDDARARAFLASDYPQVLNAYDAAPHPAMKSDVLRLAIIHTFGGVYLDADMGVVDSVATMWGINESAIVFKWLEDERHNSPNWCFGFSAGHPAVEFMLTATLHSVEKALQDDIQNALKSILTVSGPGLFTQAVATYMDQNSAQNDIRVLSVETAYQWLRNGPAVLGAPLDYKSTDRHWLVASKSDDG